MIKGYIHLEKVLNELTNAIRSTEKAQNLLNAVGVGSQDRDLILVKNITDSLKMARARLEKRTPDHISEIITP